MTASRRSLLPALLLFVTACDLDKPAPLAATDGSTDPPAQPTALQYGAPCELGPPEAWEETTVPDGESDGPQATVLTHSEQCAGSMCLLVHDDTLPVSCEVDADCGTPDAACSAGRCVLTSQYVAEHARCTQACESDADCPDIDGCAGGVSCVVISLLGSHCCEPVCACNDRLSASKSQEKAATCAGGFAGCP